MKKPSDAIAWLWNNTLGQWLLLAAVALVVLLALLQIWILDSAPDLYNKLDLTLKISGGLFLIIGLGIAAWRSATFERQIESAIKGQYSERFAKAVEQIASDQLATRLGGLASIEALSKETNSEFIRVWTYLGEFLRYPPELAQWRDEPKAGKSKKEYLGRRPDIAAVAAMLCSFDKTHLRWMEEKRLSLIDAKLQGAQLCYANLIGANLIGARLQNANLFHANLQNAKLQNANLFHVNLQNANLFHVNLQNANLFHVNLQNAKLQNANLFHVNLQNANLFHANLQNAKLQNANLFHVNLEGTNLQGANLQGANLLDVSLHERGIQQLFSKDSGVLLKDAFFSLDLLKKALHIKDLAPEKMSDIYYDDSDGPLPEDWAGDYNPQPIAYTEWLEKRK